MNSKVKKLQQKKIDQYFTLQARTRNDDCNSGVQNVDAHNHLLDDEVIFEKEVLPKKSVKRKADKVSVLKPPVKKVSNLLKSCVQPVEARLSLTRRCESSPVIAKSTVSVVDSFTKLKTPKNYETCTSGKGAISKIEKEVNEIQLIENSKASPQLCSDEISGDCFFIEETNELLNHKDKSAIDLNDLCFEVAEKEPTITKQIQVPEKEQVEIPKKVQVKIPEKEQVEIPKRVQVEVPEKVEPLFDEKIVNNFIVLSVKKEHNGNLNVELKQNELKINCVLRGLWATTPLKVGDYVNIKSINFDGSTVYIDKDDGFIVLNPEKLVNSTSISSAVFCMRKTWLNEKFSSYGSQNKYMLVGSIVHDLFQTACVQKLKEPQQLQELLNSLIDNAYVLDGCYANRITIDKLMEDIQLYIPSIIAWLQKYVHNGPSSISSDNNQKVRVVNVTDIEDNYWCTGLGLKGKIDANVEVEIHTKNSFAKRNVPLELKTGRPSFSFEHQGQVSLYSMMMDESQYAPCDTGLLLYLKEKPEMKQVRVKPSDRTALIQLRNELVSFSDDFKIGPPPLNNDRICSNCDCLLPCSLMLKCFNEINLNDSDLMSTTLVPQATSHLSDNHAMFFKKWVSMTHMEILAKDRDRSSAQNSFWKQSAVECESKGLGFSDMVFSKMTDSVYTFTRKASENKPLGTDTTNIRIGDRVALSEDKCISLNPRISFAIGFVNKIETNQIDIRLDKALHESFQGITIRVDLLPIDHSFSQYFSNILHLMLNDERAANLRRFIIDRQRPNFRATVARKVVNVCQPIVKPLNKSQQKAVLKSIAANDYVLICGTPGAGKTTTIVSIIRVLAAFKKSVFITSYTHAALDNILLKLKQFEIDFIRLGVSSRIHPDIRKYSLENKMKNIKSVEETNKFYMNIPVVASTCLSLSHPIFEVRTFDYCLMDEASQVNLLVSLGPLFVAKKFILVGDSKQLPPVVKSKDAKRLGFDISLFSLLCDEETVNLTMQYRMNEEIMRVASKLTYDGLLECGSSEISTATLTQRTNVTFKKPWIAKVLSSDLSMSVIFADTDQVPAKEEQDESGIVCNRVEAKLVSILVGNLISNFELTSNQIGVITPYVKQVDVLREICKDVEINTVDQYQGRDKDAIIISTVVNSEEKIAKELLKDSRRLNVAITRAKKKLVIVGSRQTLSLYEPFQNLFSILKEHQFFELPIGAHLYNCDL